MDNHVAVTAASADAQPVRYTPAGLPALDLRLEHGSRQMDAGQARDVKLAIKAMAFGTLAERLARQNLGSCFRFQGFLAKSRNGKSVVLHIQDIQQD